MTAEAKTIICRGCSCTQDCSCPGGCAWVTPDLCSRCISPVLATWPIETEMLFQLIGLHLSVLTLLTIHGHLLPALRHVQPTVPGSEMVRNIIEQIEEVLIARGALSLDQVEEIHRAEKADRPRIILVSG